MRHRRRSICKPGGVGRKHSHAVGDMRQNDGTKSYRVSVAGTSAASGGPTGTVGSIVDGTVTWLYQSPSTGPSGTGSLIRDGEIYWEYVSADAGIPIPPAGHAQSADVWAKVFPSSPQANPDVHPFYPVWPAVVAGGSSVYRLGFNFWSDQASARNTFVGMYVESNCPYSLIEAPTVMVSGNAPLDAASTGIIYSSSTIAATIAPALEVLGKNDATNTREYATDIGRSAGESLGLRVLGDGGSTLATALSFAWVWDELTGTWIRQHARNGARVAQRLTTTLNNITGGRADPIGAGNTLFTQGFWVGRHPTYTRHFTMAEAMPTTGQWAAGDLVLNAQPLQGEPWGWRCILTGDFAATPPVFQPLRDTGSQQTIATDAIFTLTPGTSPYRTLHTGTLTANRAVTLSTTGALQGLNYRITRTGAGAFSLNVGTGPLKALATNTWGEFTYDGSGLLSVRLRGALGRPIMERVAIRMSTMTLNTGFWDMPRASLNVSGPDSEPRASAAGTIPRRSSVRLPLVTAGAGSSHRYGISNGNWRSRWPGPNRRRRSPRHLRPRLRSPARPLRPGGQCVTWYASETSRRD